MRRLRGAVLLFLLLLLLVTHARGEGAPKGTVIWIETDQMRLTVYENGREKASYPIAAGKKETPSPLGVFRITHRFATELSGFGTRFLGLNVSWGSYGIHGTNRPESIGRAASHGCIRLSVKNAEVLYGMIANGTKVVIEGGPYGPLGWGMRALKEGDRGADVKQLQLRLIQRGYLWGGADGVFGTATRRAVIAARAALSLPAGDMADEALQKALGMMLFE